MKFYRDNYKHIYWCEIKSNKLTAIYCDNIVIRFFKNSMYHNAKNAAYIRLDGYKEFWLNNKSYHNKYVFTKKSWRRFVKMQAFL